MWQGDSLQVLLFFVGMALGAVIGAIPTPAGNGRNFLWCVAVLFALAALGWLIAPSASPIVQAIEPIAAALIQSGAPVIIGTVGIVAIMLKRQSPPPKNGVDFAKFPMAQASSFPDFASGAKSKWAPDIAFMDGAFYLLEEAYWGARSIRQPTDARDALFEALRQGKITGWGKEHPDDTTEYQIDRQFWADVEFTPGPDFAYSGSIGERVYAVRLCRAEMQEVWPIRPDSPAST